MITAPTLSDTIASDAHDLRDAYPKGATPHDLAGWFGQPIAKIEAALADMRERGDDLSFLRSEPVKNPAAVAMGQKGGRARAEKIAPGRRSEIAQKAAASRWAKGSPDHPRRKELTDPQKRAIMMTARFEELAKAFPLGATAPEVANFYGFTLVHTYEAMRVLDESGQADWGPEYHGGTQYFYVVGMHKRMPPLTEKQERLYHAMLEDAGGTGELRVVYKRMGERLGIQGTSVMSMCDILERKSYVRRLTPLGRSGNQNSSPMYAVYGPEPRPVDPTAKLAKRLQTSVEIEDELHFEESDPPAIHKALARRKEVIAELAKLNSFLRLYGELDGVDESE